MNIENAGEPGASFVVPNDGGRGDIIHFICEVTDIGTSPPGGYCRFMC